MTKEKTLIKEIEERYMKENNVSYVGTINKDAWEFAIKIFNKKLDKLKERLSNIDYDDCENVIESKVLNEVNKIFGKINSQQDTFVNLDLVKSKHDLKEKGSERGTSADLTSNARGLEEADEDTSRSLAADNSSKKGCGKPFKINNMVKKCGIIDEVNNLVWFCDKCKEETNK